MFYRVFLFLIIFNCFDYIKCLKYSIKENHNIKVEPFKTPINKRDISQFFDKASYSFNGLQKIESVPIIFPLDICFFNVNSIRYAACLHINKNEVRNFVIFSAENRTYEELYNLETPLAIGMDCTSFGPKGYVAIAYNLTNPVERANQGSPIFQIDSDRIKIIQYFGSQSLRAVYLRASANDLFLLQTYVNTDNATHFCPYFKWSGYGFNKLGKIQCSNAKRLEPFSIDSESYVAVANYADQYGRTHTNSVIYKYDREKKKLVSFQKIKTHGAVDVKYFSVPFEEIKKQHFLIFGNSVASGNNQQDDQIEPKSVIYKFEKGTFVPYQSLALYSVEKFLPVENIDLEKFILLVACSNQEIKIFNMNDWKFEESKAQFTEGAFGKGVSNMRIFEEDDLSYLVIANERMMENETNVFLPIFTQEEHANTLRQQIIDWSLEAIDRLSKIDVEKLKNDVLAAGKLKKDRRTAEITEISSANIEIAYTRSFINSQRNFTASYWKTLSYAQQSLEVLEARANRKSLMKRHTSDKDKIEYVQDNINVGTLVVRNKFKAQKINGIDLSNIQLNKVSAPKVIVNGNFKRPTQPRSDITPEFVDAMNVEHLMIKGKLNDISWSDLQLNTLKRSGQQFIKAPIKIGNLQTDSLFVASETVNGQSLSKLVRTDGGSYVVNQDVQFAKSIYAKNLTIHDRLNNIHVLQNKLDVLLLNSDEVQHMTGQKTFENVRLLEPVKISGKLFGNLNLMSPFKPIHEPLNLTGDYTITGDVTISNLLTAQNIFGSSGEFSIKKALDQGLRSSGSLNGLKLTFQHPIEANNSIVSFINGFDLQQLVPTGSDEVQIIEGHKVFKGNVQISDGFAEVKILNGIEVDDFENRVLTKDGMQNITGNFKFNKLIVKSLTSASIELLGKNLSEYLTTSGDQVSEGTLDVESFETHFAKVENIQTKHRVFKTQLGNLNHNDTEPNTEIFNNYPGTIRVENLKIAGFINKKPIKEIEELLAQLSGNVKYVGRMKLPSDITVSNLSFTGKLNGIPAQEFGNCWLQQGREQTFTAPQTLSNVEAGKGLKLSDGKLNGHEFEELISGVYLINRDEHIHNAIFENSINVKTTLKTSTVNGLRIPDDILTRDSTEAQIFNEPITCQKDIHVKGKIRKLSIVNKLNLERLNDVIDSDLETIAVQNAVFEKPPHFGRLNSHNLKKIMESVWFANENVDLQHHVEIADGYFEGPIDFEGPINGMNLKYLKENYFSLTKPQQISAEMIFSKPVVFENDFDVEELHLFGPIIETTSTSEIDFDDFVEHSLLTSGKQHVTGQWKIYEAFVSGDLKNIRINNLNLVDDVIRLDVAQNIVTGHKRVSSASIKNLYCQPRSTVNDVDLTEWIYNTVFVYENYTIQGKTTVDSAILYSDIEVLGTVNNMSFDEQNLLLRNKDQVIYGNVQIMNKFPEEKRILSNTFEEVQTENVNGINIDEFFKNQILEDNVKLPISLDRSVIFEKTVNTQRFESEADLRDSKEISFDYNQMHNKTVKAFDQLEQIVERIAESYKDTKYYLSHFEQKQTMIIQAQKVVSLTLKVNDEFIDVIGVLKDNQDLSFYRWDFYQQQFVLDKHLSWLPRRKALIDIFRIAFGDAEYVSIKKSLEDNFYPNVMSMETEGLEGVFNDKNSSVEALELDGQHCLVTNKETDGILGLFCVEHNDSGLKFVQKNNINKYGVIQIASLEENLIAILLNDSVEIWKPNEPEKCKQKIPAVTPSQIAAVVTKDSVKFIAICSKIKPKSFHHELVDIYTSTEDNPFQLMQTIEVVSPLQVEFVLLPESKDILLSILTESFNEPLAIYQYKGVVGFQSIVGSSTITPGTSISVIHLKACGQHLIAVMSKDEMTIIEAVLHKT